MCDEIGCATARRYACVCVVIRGGARLRPLAHGGALKAGSARVRCPSRRRSSRVWYEHEHEDEHDHDHDHEHDHEHDHKHDHGMNMNTKMNMTMTMNMN